MAVLVHVYAASKVFGNSTWGTASNSLSIMKGLPKICELGLQSKSETSPVKFIEFVKGLDRVQLLLVNFLELVDHHLCLVISGSHDCGRTSRAPD